MGSTGQVVYSGVSIVQNVDKLFFKIRWPQCGFHKKRARTRYVEHLFLHPVGFAGYVVHFGSSGKQNIDALFFMLGWDRYEFDKEAC
jgi:hypothetical protein